VEKGASNEDASIRYKQRVRATNPKKEHAIKKKNRRPPPGPEKKVREDTGTGIDAATKEIGD